MLTSQETVEKVEYVLGKLRPYLQRDGGDVELAEIKDGVVYVRLLGACVGCGAVDITLKEGIETAILETVPGIIAVEALDPDLDIENLMY
jgi:Fe-S cluster biogenesis protein NfuA